MATAARRRNSDLKYNGISYGAYDGSAARQLEREEVLQPRPQVRPRERAAVRPRVQAREAGAVSLFAVAGFLAVGVCTVLLLFSYVQLNTISEQVVSLRSELTTLKSEEATLRAQYELAYDLEVIERQMTADGGMVKPQSGQVIYVDLSEPDAVTFFQQEEALTGAAGAFASVKSICGEILEYFK